VQDNVEYQYFLLTVIVQLNRFLTLLCTIGIGNVIMELHVKSLETYRVHMAFWCTYRAHKLIKFTKKSVKKSHIFFQS
jgi:hypothetical protein